MSLREAEEAVHAGPPSHALSVIERALKVSVTDTSTRVRLLDLRAATLESAGDLPAATSAAREMTAVDAHDARGYLRLGKVLRLTGDVQRAACVYRAGLAKVVDAKGRAAIEKQLQRVSLSLEPPIDIFGILPLEVVLRILRSMHHAARWSVLTTTKAASGIVPHALAVKSLLRVHLPPRPSTLAIDRLHPCVTNVVVSSSAAFEALLRSKLAKDLTRLTVLNSALSPFHTELPFSSLRSLRFCNAVFSDAQSLLQSLPSLANLGDLRFASCSCRYPTELPFAAIRIFPLRLLSIVNCASSLPTEAIIAMSNAKTLVCNAQNIFLPGTPPFYEFATEAILPKRIYLGAAPVAARTIHCRLHTAVLVDGQSPALLRSSIDALPRHLQCLYVCSSSFTVRELYAALPRFDSIRSVGLITRGNVSAAFCGLDGSRAVEILVAAAPTVSTLLLPALDLLPRQALAAIQARFPNVRIVASPQLCATIVNLGFHIPREL